MTSLKSRGWFLPNFTCSIYGPWEQIILFFLHNRIRILVILILTYTGKSESWHLKLLSHCRYFAKSFTEMFLYQTFLSKHLNLIGLPWQPRGSICGKNIQKIISSEAIRGIKLKLWNVCNISLFKKIFTVALVLSLLWQLKIPIDMMGKVKIGL